MFYGFFEFLQKEDFFLYKPNFLSIMRVEGSLLFLKKMLIIALDPVVRSSIKFNHGLSVNQSFKT